MSIYKSYTAHHIKEMISKIQDLEEISGPDTIEEYITVLVALKLEIDTRIQNAVTIIKEEA